ncbi:aldo/keto reductase [Streptomyces sp. NP160]|nr:aldo/keto reductase [Streptomyces sp. NP160]
MPLIGLGTWESSGGQAYRAVRDALDIGYRHVDTATYYANEDQVGAAVRDSGLAREDVFVTTKMPQGNAGRERKTLEESLRAAGLEHLDLWLIHWPPGGQARPDVWEEFIKARTDGLVRAIGVSNYSIAQIDELTAATGVTPAVNQIKWGPGLFDASLVAAHAERGVALEGWSPFKSTDLAALSLTAAARRHGVTVQQVIIRWHVQHGVVVIPKSSQRERIASNFDIFDFELSADEMRDVDALGRSR